jgi:hypothetical protein
MQESSAEFPYGNYTYRSFNIAGELIGDGTLYINQLNSNKIEGNWSIRNIKNCTVCGPQYGSGFLTGRIENDSMFINLNPNIPQNYVELVGELKDNTFVGDWRWFESVVNSNRGTFRAVRN